MLQNSVNASELDFVGRIQGIGDEKYSASLAG